MQSAYRHIFFDLDRTLWDYDRNSTEALHEIFESFQLDKICMDFNRFHSFFERYNDEVWKAYREGRMHKDLVRTVRFEKTLEMFGIVDKEMAASLNAKFLEISPRKPHLLPGTLELLQYLTEKRYQLYIITNGFTGIQRIKMDTTGLLGFFNQVFTSENTASNKPNRGIFEKAVTAVNAKKNQSLMVGDDLEVDIIGARNFGMDQVFFNRYNISHKEKVTFEIQELSELTLIL